MIIPVNFTSLSFHFIKWQTSKYIRLEIELILIVLETCEIRYTVKTLSKQSTLTDIKAIKLNCDLTLLHCSKLQCSSYKNDTATSFEVTKSTWNVKQLACVKSKKTEILRCRSSK